MHRCVGYIPVRGGSKGIRNKNIAEVGGKPLIYWTAKAASRCMGVDHVFIATDSNKIANVVNSFGFKGVSTIDRKPATATDGASTESAMLEFARRKEFSEIILMQATSPLLTTKDLEAGIKKYRTGKYGSVISVVRQRRMLLGEKEGQTIPINYNPARRPRRQDWDGFLVENGAFFITSKDNLLNSRCRMSGVLGYHEMPEETYWEIDEPKDLGMLDYLLRKKYGIPIKDIQEA